MRANASFFRLRRLQDRPLSWQLLAPMLFIGGVCLVAVLYSAVVLTDSVNELGVAYKSSDRRLQVLENIEANVTSVRALSLRHLASEQYSVMQDIQSELERAFESIQNGIDEVSKTSDSDDPAFVADRTRLASSVTEYLRHINETIQLSADFEKESAFVRLTACDNNHLPVVMQSLRELKTHALERVTRVRSQLVDDADRNLSSTIFFGISGVALLMLISLLVAWGVTQRVSRLLQWTREVSSGNFTAQLQNDSDDEVGNLTRAMKEMADNIHLAHKELHDAKLEAENNAEELRLYANAFDSSGEAMLITDENNRIINVNTAFTRQTGYLPDEVIGRDPKLFASGKTPALVYQEMWRALNERDFWQGELWDRKRNGETYPKWIRISAIRDTQHKIVFYIASFTDISDRKEAEARIEHLAHHDILTGLHNRFSLEERLEQAVASARREQQRIALLFIDLDRFKNINDSLGHQVGDQLLIEVACRLKACVRESDIVARIGGDEFIVVLVAINDNSGAAHVAENILTSVSQQYEINGHIINTTPSIGISIFPDDGAVGYELMKAADVAMYHAKEQGRNNYHYFNDAMLVAASERLRIERELRVAVNNNQLELHYQPQVRTSDGRIVTVEALVRWNHPSEGLIFPEQFISVAEESGIIFDLDRWVVTQVCRQLVAWRSIGVSNCKIALNISARQLQSENLSEEIENILQSHDLDGHQLEIEITETAAMKNPALAIAQLNALRRLGISIAIDDFGTGYSSLSYLKQLPINTLKLDRSFVRDIGHDENDEVICTATVALAHNLGLKIVAEGVETEAQREFLTGLNYDFLQGYIYTCALPAQEITELLTQCAEKA